VDSPVFKNAAEKIGFEIGFLPAKEFGNVIASDDKEIAALMVELGLKK